jgi:adenine phosphoribosyltransferase
LDALKAKIRHVPDFPKAGILFYDVTTLLRDPDGFRVAIDSLANPYKDRGISLVVGIESRGFILGAAVADRIGAGFVPVRKVGKLQHRPRSRRWPPSQASSSVWNRAAKRRRSPVSPSRRGTFRSRASNR